MESKKLLILENFPLVSVVMPYYSYTHRMFLLLSELSKKTRMCLIKNYKIFIRIMICYSMDKNVTFKELSQLLIPSDLFKIIINDYCENGVQELIIFVTKLNNKEGCWFEEYYMNEQICLDRIYVPPEYIEDLHPYISCLKSIQIIDFSKPYDRKELSATLLDMIMLNDIAIYSDSESNVKFPYFQDDDCTIVNPVYQCFKRVGEIYFNNKTVMKLLEMILKTDFNEIELLNFHEVDPSLFCTAMNPSIFNFKVQRIGYRNPNWPLISNKALSNIDKINPKELIFSGFTFNPNCFRVLSNLPNNITVYFGCDSSNTFNLKFVNADVFIKSNKESLKLQCKEICLDCRNLDNNEIFFLENEIICICYFKGIKINNFKNEINEQDRLSHAFNVERTEISNYLTIQMNRGSEIMLSLDELLQLFENKENTLIFSSLSLHIKLVIKLETLNEVIEFSKVSMYIPKHCELEIVEIDYYDEPDNSDEKVEVFTSILIDLVTNFKLRSLKAYKINEKHNLILLLSHPSVQNSLRYIDCMNCCTSECLNILCLCKELRQLEFVQIFLLDTPKDEFYKLVAAEKNEIKRFNVNIKCINIKHYN